MPGDFDFGTLAARLVSSLDDVRGCLLVSADGMTLGVFPKERETDVREVWDRLRSIGDLQRGFVAFGDEVWGLARRGPYAGVVVAGAAATPGLVLDGLESTLRSAEGMRLGNASSAPPREDTVRPVALLLRHSGEKGKTPSGEPRGASDDVTKASGPGLSDPVRAAQEFIARILGTDGAGNGEHRAMGASGGSTEESSPVADAPHEESAQVDGDVARAGEDIPEIGGEKLAAEDSSENSSRPKADAADEVDAVALVWEFRDLASESDG